MPLTGISTVFTLLSVISVIILRAAISQSEQTKIRVSPNFPRNSDSLMARQQGQLSYVAEFTPSIIHVPGRLNIVAKLMSRPTQGVPASGPAREAGVKVPSGLLAPSRQQVAPVMVVMAADSVDLELLAKEQISCPSILQQLGHNSCCVTFLLAATGRWFRCPEDGKCSWWSTPWPTWGLLSTRFVWKGMAADVGQWCRECEACQKAKIRT